VEHLSRRPLLVELVVGSPVYRRLRLLGFGHPQAHRVLVARALDEILLAALRAVHDHVLDVVGTGNGLTRVEPNPAVRHRAPADRRSQEVVGGRPQEDIVGRVAVSRVDDVHAAVAQRLNDSLAVVCGVVSAVLGRPLLVPALVLMRAGLLSDVLGHVFVAGGLGALGEQLLALAPPATGWTFYAPLSVQLELPTVSVVLLGLHLSGVATTMSAINFIATIFTERDVAWRDLDIFSWTMLTQSGLILFAFPLLGSALVMLLLDRTVGTTFFAIQGGSPILWQHLFWFFGHPEVYILVLPPMGIVSLLIPKFSGRKLFGFKFVVYSTLAIGVLSFGVWAHHMFTTGIDPRLRASFMAVSIAIAVPSAVKVFNWITTMWNGHVRLTAPMLFCVGGVATFVVGGVTGIFLAAIPIDLLLHDTYYVVGHFHFIIMGLISFAFFAGVYYWYPLVVGKHTDYRLSVAHFLLTTVGIVLAFGPMMIMGQEGLPRRYASYPAEFAGLQQVATLGAILIALGTVVWLFNLVQSYRMGDPVTTDDPWNLREHGDRRTAEWDELPYGRE